MSNYKNGDEEKDRIAKIRSEGIDNWKKVRLEVQKRGGKWVAENGLTYTWEGNVIIAEDTEAGVGQIMFSNATSDAPNVMSVLEYDYQYTHPETRRKLIENTNMEKRKIIELYNNGLQTKEPETSCAPMEIQNNTIEEKPKEIEKKVKAWRQTEIIVIVEKDWLSRISLKRWGTIDWKKHLKPTQMTLNSPKRRGKRFNPDLIYPGDQFEVIH